MTINKRLNPEEGKPLVESLSIIHQVLLMESDVIAHKNTPEFHFKEFSLKSSADIPLSLWGLFPGFEPGAVGWPCDAWCDTCLIVISLTTAVFAYIFTIYT